MDPTWKELVLHFGEGIYIEKGGSPGDVVTEVAISLAGRLRIHNTRGPRGLDWKPDYGAPDTVLHLEGLAWAIQGQNTPGPTTVSLYLLELNRETRTLKLAVNSGFRSWKVQPADKFKLFD